MLILFDHGTPQGLARPLPNHTIITAKAKGWDRLNNGALLKVAEESAFDLLLTTDQRTWQVGRLPSLFWQVLRNALNSSIEAADLHLQVATFGQRAQISVSGTKSFIRSPDLARLRIVI
jgi:hypothetical protein